MPRGSARRNELILLQSNDRPSPHDPQAKAESIKIRVLIRPVNGKNLPPIRGMPGRLTRDPSPKYGLSKVKHPLFYALQLVGWNLALPSILGHKKAAPSLLGAA